MNNQRFLKRPQQHYNDEGRPIKRPRWRHQGPRPNYQHNQNFNPERYEPSSYQPWRNPRRGSFHPHQTRPFYQAPHQQQFFQGHNNYSQNRGPPPMYNNNQQQQQWNPSFPPSNQFPWHNQSHQQPRPSREADYNPSDSSASSSPSYPSTSKSDAFPGYFTTAISQPNSSPSGSTEYEPVFSTTITAKTRPTPSQTVVPMKSEVVRSKKNKVVDVLGILDPKLIQIVQYLSTFQREMQESCDGKEKEELTEDVQVPKESKRQKDVNDNNSASKINVKTVKADGHECIRLLYQNKHCGSCEGVFRDVGAHECLEEKSCGQWYPSKDDWINDRAISDEITKD